jgi:UDP-4-amino-4,6-dideoxy-N-acetyl-beta-L-altrosamine transaminase
MDANHPRGWRIGGDAPFAEDAAAASPLLPYARQWIDEADIAAVAGVLRSDFLTQGPAIERFEAALAAATGAGHAVAVASGTAALHLVCEALGLGPGAVGVTSPITFAASANCFLYAGAKAAFSDVDPASGLLDPAGLDTTLAGLSAAGSPPGIVVAVSLAGRVPGLPVLQGICARHGWTLVEDAAHSLGATYAAEGRTCASGSCAHTRAAILSFHPVKHITCGEGGAVLTNDAGVAERVRLLRSHGMRKPAPAARPAMEGDWFYEQEALGYHYRMTELQAALGTSQLARLPAFLARRRELARRYAETLAGEPFCRVLRPPVAEAGHAWHLFVVHFRDEGLRRRAYDFLAARGIRTQVHYIPVYRHPHYRRTMGGTRLPGAEAWYRGCLSLPLYPKMSDADQDRVLADLAVFAAAHG